MFKNDASNNLSYEEMCYQVNKNHPRKVVKDPTSEIENFEKYGWCGTNTGSHSCI